MKQTVHCVVSIAVVMLAGCATLPTGPGVTVMPTPGKSFEVFQKEDTICRQWAERQVGLPVQETYDKNMAANAVGGAAIGTGVGALFGAASGHAGTGALVGAASGLLLGSAVGSDQGRLYGYAAQRRYDSAYMQCMYTYNNQVPGYRPNTSPAPVPPPAAPAPPPAPVYEPAPPQSFSLDEAPRFVYSPPLNAYVAVDVPYDLVYDGSAYYYYSGGYWYRSHYYNGPWGFVARAAYPSLFVRFDVGNIRHYRDSEMHRYRQYRDRYDGRFHRPDFHR